MAKEKQQEERYFVVGHKNTKKGMVTQSGDEVYYPTFTARLFACTLDILLLSIVVLFLLSPFSKMLETDNTAAIRFVERLSRDEIADENLMPEFITVMSNPEVIHNVLANFILQYVVFGIIIIGFWFWRAATPGKMLFGMRIVDAETLAPPSRRQYIIRYLSYMLSALAFGLGFAWMVFNKKHRSWHDYLAGTAVVFKKKPRFIR